MGVPQTLSYFDKMQDRIVNFVTSNSNISEQDFRNLMLQTGELTMDMGTVVDGERAVELGLIDSLGGLSDAIDCLYSLIEESGEKYPDNEKKGGLSNGASYNYQSGRHFFTIFPRIWKILKKMRKYALRTLFTTLNRMSITNKIYKCGNDFRYISGGQNEYF